MRIRKIESGAKYKIHEQSKIFQFSEFQYFSKMKNSENSLISQVVKLWNFPKISNLENSKTNL